jgi:hypothetical protein
MTRYGFPHLRNRLRKLRDALKFPQFLCARVTGVIEILPASRRIFADNLHSSSRCRIDRDISPGRRNLQLVDPIEIGFRETATHRFVAKTSFRTSKATYANVLQTFDICHCC